MVYWVMLALVLVSCSQETTKRQRPHQSAESKNPPATSQSRVSTSTAPESEILTSQTPHPQAPSPDTPKTQPTSPNPMPIPVPSASEPSRPLPASEGLESDKPVATTPPPPSSSATSADPYLVEFHIPSTYDGKTQLNSHSTPIKLKVYSGSKKQVLRIYNDSNTRFALHTNGSPCPHGQVIPKGSFADCEVQKPVQLKNKSARPANYDHFNPQIGIWIEAVATSEPTSTPLP